MNTNYSNCQNRTVGDKNGSDNTAVLFSPFKWQADRGETWYELHVGDVDTSSGQQYSMCEFMETSQPGLQPPEQCNIPTFYEICTEYTNFMGVLLMTGHGSRKSVSIEAYQPDSTGENAMFTKYIDYRDGYGSMPPLSATELIMAYVGQSPHPVYPVISLQTPFIENHATMGKSLVYIGVCEGGHQADEWFDAGARFAVGNDASVYPSEQYIRISTFFERLDGYGDDGIYDRRADSAVGDLDTCLIWDGEPNTTLSPAIVSYYAPTPLNVGDSIIFNFETCCDTNQSIDIHGLHCTIENERWIDTLTAVGYCTAAPSSGVTSYGAVLNGDVNSDNNWSVLDGNTNPRGPGTFNAKGPSGDDYTFLITGGSDQSFYMCQSGYLPLGNPINSEWQRLHPDLSTDWLVNDWFDDGDYHLDANDTIEIFNSSTQDTLLELIDVITPFIEIEVSGKDIYLEMIDNNPLILNWPNPLGTFWVEVAPDYTIGYLLYDWSDDDNSYTLNTNDYIQLYTLNGPDSGQVIQSIKLNIVICIERI
jgi:hypothetical protein